MADKEKEERDSFLRSILNRGPNKRQIKPAENNSLLQLALGEDSEDSEEDEDFELNDDDDDEGGSGSEEENDNTENNDRGQTSKQAMEVSDDDDDNDEQDDDDDNDEDAATTTLTVGDLIQAMKTKKKIPVSQPSSVASSEVSASSKKVDILICGICLDDVSDEGDEIVECDNCGITVHEGCYGINDEDSDSGKSNDTDSPTELWFCDACKIGLQPDCELCPNLGGIFKETDTGQWVHLLCALYTPDVAFVKPEQLQCVTLSELPPYKWSAKDCNLCEDERFCRTGVCIECDAGMCRTYFHVTCAQMYGLLSDVPEECDEDVADPLFAHCRLHADKRTTASRRRTWLAYQSRYKKASERRSAEDKERVKHCLEAVRKDFQAKRMKNAPKYYTPTEKIPRLLSTCPGACRQLFKKAQLLGYTTGQTQNVVNVRRKWFVQPALTSEFVNYYHDRSARLKEMQERQEELECNNKRLQQEEQDLREKYQELTETLQFLAKDIQERRQESTRLHRCLCKLAGKELAQPPILETKKPKHSASQTRMKPIKLYMCNTCKTTENQHQLVQCDTCHYHYHLACVDPPLTRMPKRSAKCLWQCSECDPSDDDDEMEVDPEDTTPISQGRQRRVIKEPTKFTPDKAESKKRKLNKSLKRKTPAADGGQGENSTADNKVLQTVSNKESANTNIQTTIQTPKLETSSEPAGKRGRRPRTKSTEPPEKKKKPDDVRTECSVCKQSGTNANLVRCDQCKLCYHYQCLDPPIKANPKTRGYQWFCTECDESEEESEEDVDVEETSTVDYQTESITKQDSETKQKYNEQDVNKADEDSEKRGKDVKKADEEKEKSEDVKKTDKEKEKQERDFKKAEKERREEDVKKADEEKEKREDVKKPDKEKEKQEKDFKKAEKERREEDVKKAAKEKHGQDVKKAEKEKREEDVKKTDKEKAKREKDLNKPDKEKDSPEKDVNKGDKEKEKREKDVKKVDKEKERRDEDVKKAEKEKEKREKDLKKVDKVKERRDEDEKKAEKEKEKREKDVKKTEKEKERRDEDVKKAEKEKEKREKDVKKTEKEKERRDEDVKKTEKEKEKREKDVKKTEKEKREKVVKKADEERKKQEDDDENASLASLVRKEKKGTS